MAITMQDHPRTVRLGFRIAVCETQEDIDWVRKNHKDVQETGHPMHLKIMTDPPPI